MPLPQSMKIHNVFYPNLLCKALLNPLTNQLNKSPAPVIINIQKKWEVEDIFDATSHYGKR